MSQIGRPYALPLSYARTEPVPGADTELTWVVRYVGLYIVCMAGSPLLRMSVLLGFYGWMHGFAVLGLNARFYLQIALWMAGVVCGLALYLRWGVGIAAAILVVVVADLYGEFGILHMPDVGDVLWGAPTCAVHVVFLLALRRRIRQRVPLPGAVAWLVWWYGAILLVGSGAYLVRNALAAPSTSPPYIVPYADGVLALTSAACAFMLMRQVRWALLLRIGMLAAWIAISVTATVGSRLAYPASANVYDVWSAEGLFIIHGLLLMAFPLALYLKARRTEAGES